MGVRRDSAGLRGLCRAEWPHCTRVGGKMAKHAKYLWYVLQHKWYVFLACCDLGIPWLGLIHDWSKFRLSEFLPYANHFKAGIKTGRNKTGYYKPTDTGDPAFDFAWFLHQKRNAHHWQYWALPEEGGETVKFLLMLDKYRREMLADWRGAGRAQGTPDTKAWYKANGNKIGLHRETRRWIEEALGLDCGCWEL